LEAKAKHLFYRQFITYTATSFIRITIFVAQMQHMILIRSLKMIFTKLMKAIGYLLLIFFAVLLIFYLTAPVYHFDEPEPFSGEFIHNPYLGMNPDYWRKYNFQVQSRAWGGITDGRQNTNEMIDSIYHLLGYDYVATSDYQRINYHGSENKRFIPTYEHGFGIRKTHQVCIGAEKVLWIDYPFFQNLSHKQGIIDKLNKQCDLVALAHPSLRSGYKVSDMKYLSNYPLMEVLTNMRVSTEHWDEALSHGHLVYVLSNDDAHDVLNSNEVGRRFTMINAPDMRRETVTDALGNGLAYGMDFYRIDDEPMEHKIERSRNIPFLLAADLANNIFEVEVSELAATFRFIGQGGKLLHEVVHDSSAQYSISAEDTYVRTEIAFPDGSVMYLNPVTRHPGPYPVRQNISQVNHTKTALYRGIYLILIVIALRFIYKWQVGQALKKLNKKA
jgi:hypothetical protein